MLRCINTKALCNLTEILVGKYYHDVSHVDCMVSGLYNFISSSTRLLFQTTKTVLRTFLCVAACFYFESKGSLGRVENIINMERVGWQIFLVRLQLPSPFPFVSCTTTPVNSSAHSTPSPPEMPTLQADEG